MADTQRVTERVTASNRNSGSNRLAFGWTIYVPDGQRGMGQVSFLEIDLPFTEGI